MKKIIRNPLFIMISFALLFLFGSLTTFYGFNLFIPIITFYGRGALNILPTILTCGVPLFSLIILWINIHNKNIKSRWKTLYIYGLILTGVMFVCLILQTLITIFIYKGRLTTSISPLFPFDILVFQVIYFVIGVLVLIYCYKNKEQLYVPSTLPPVKKGKVVAFSFMMFLSQYFFGVLAFIPEIYFDGYFDHNCWMIVSTLLMHVVPVAMIVLYFLYKHVYKTRKFYFVSLVSLIATFIILLILLLTANFINPKYIYESMQPFYQFGLTVNIPFELFIICIGVFVILIVATVRFLKNNNIYDEKEKE